MYRIDLFESQIEGKTWNFHLDERFFKRTGGWIEAGRIESFVTCLSAICDTFVFQIHSVGAVEVACDRCLSPLSMAIDTTDVLHVMLSDDEGDDGDVVAVSADTGVLDMGQPIYEFVALSLPVRCVHELGGCDASMIEEVRKYQIATGDDKEVKGMTGSCDPRWNVLKDIYF